MYLTQICLKIKKENIDDKKENIDDKKKKNNWR